MTFDLAELLNMTFTELYENTRLSPENRLKFSDAAFDIIQKAFYNQKLTDAEKYDEGYSKIFHINLNCPNRPSSLKLKNTDQKDGTISEIIFANEKSTNLFNRITGFQETNARIFEANFKFHISIADFANTKISDMLEFAEFLKNQVNSEHLFFSYKLINLAFILFKQEWEREPDPSITRFLSNDQFTLYFDRYSSLAAMLNFADAVEKFLQSKGYTAPESTGLKDIISLNPYVSARNDGLRTRYSYLYGELPFFDRECAKFINQYKEELKTNDNLPISAFEIILHMCLALPTFSIEEMTQLSEEHSKIVQYWFL